MKPHIAQTVSDLKSTVARLNGLISFLESFGDGLDDPIFPVTVERGTATIEDPSVLTFPSAPSKPSRKLNLAKKAFTPVGNLRKSNSEKMLAAARSLKNPITQAQLREVSGLDKSTVNSYLMRWKNNGWVAPIGKGAYEKTIAFGKSESRAFNPPPAKPAAPVGRVTSPGAPTRAELQAKLDDALKQRDHARATGRDTLVEMFQKDIDQLEAQLANA